MGDIGTVMRKQHNKLGEVLVKKTHFSLIEIENLFGVYRKASCCNCGSASGKFLQKKLMKLPQSDKVKQDQNNNLI